MIGIALEELSDQDYKTQIAKGYPNIPKGAEFIFIDIVANFYGTYMKVQYNGNIYYVNPKYVQLK